MPLIKPKTMFIGAQNYSKTSVLELREYEVMASNTLSLEMYMGFVHIPCFVFADQPGCSYIFNLPFA